MIDYNGEERETDCTLLSCSKCGGMRPIISFVGDILISSKWGCEFCGSSEETIIGVRDKSEGR